MRQFKGADWYCDCSTLKLNHHWLSIDILAVADTKAEFGLQLRLREREGRVLRMGMGGSGEQRKLRSQQVRGQLSWPSQTAASNCPRLLTQFTQSLCFVVSQERYWLESSRPGWWWAPHGYFLALRGTGTRCRQPAQGVTRNLLTKCYNFFTMPRQSGHWDSSGKSEGRAVTWCPITVKRSLLFSDWKKEAGRLEIAEQLRRCQGPKRGQVPWILGGQEIHLLVAVVIRQQQRNPGEQDHDLTRIHVYCKQ